MGNTTSTRKVNFEDVQHLINNRKMYILINTLDASEQDCLIKHTVTISEEEKIINTYLTKNKAINISKYV